jgi:hypothetical protein
MLVTHTLDCHASYIKTLIDDLGVFQLDASSIMIGDEIEKNFLSHTLIRGVDLRVQPSS